MKTSSTPPSCILKPRRSPEPALFHHPDENMVFVLRHLAQHPGIDNNVALEAGRRADRIGADKPNLSRFERTQVTIPVPTLKTEKKKQAARAA